MIFDDFIERHLFTNISNRKIKRAVVNFYDINEFTLIPFYEYGEHLDPIFKLKHYSYQFENKKINIIITNHVHCDFSTFESTKEILIEFCYDKAQKYTSVLEDIYHFKAFLSIISKRRIGIKKIEVNNGGLLFLNCIKFSDNTPSNNWLARHYKDFILTIEKIDNNFSVIYDNFNKIFVDDFPIFDIYIDILEHKTSKLNKFLNYTQILEYISRKYDDYNARNTWIKNGKNGKNVTLADRIESLLNEVNFVWKFSSNKIYNLSRKIANGRNYYNHHNDERKKLNDDDLFRIPYFLEDVFLSFLYLQIGVDKNLIKSALEANIFYDRKI